jgi:hypothetical protein
MSDFIDSRGTDIEGYQEKTFITTSTLPVFYAWRATIWHWTVPSEGCDAMVSLLSGQSFTLMINMNGFNNVNFDVSGYTVDKWTGGAPPTFASTGENVLVIWKFGETVYGHYVGVAS